MYLSYNKNLFYSVLVCIFVVIIQSFAPKIYITDNINVSLDFLLILITFLILLKNTFYVVFLGFFIGLLQDMLINSYAIALCSFIKSLSVYYISKIKLNNNLWKRSYKFIYILLIYFLHFMVYYFVMSASLNFLIFLLSFLHALSALIVFYIFEKILFNSHLL